MTSQPIVQDYELTRSLISASDYSVWRGQRRSDGQSVIVQRLQIGTAPSTEEMGRILGEFDALKALALPMLPTYLDLVDDGEEEMWLIRNTTEDQRIQAKLDLGESFQPHDIEAFLAQLLDLLAILHEGDTSIIHRDINPRTVTFDGHRYGLTDFGLLTSLVPTSPPSLADPPAAYRCPKAQENGSLDISADLYSLGAVTMHLAAHLSPGELRDDRGRIPVADFLAFDSPAVPLLESLLEPDPNARPTSAREALEYLEAPVTGSPDPHRPPSTSTASPTSSAPAPLQPTTVDEPDTHTAPSSPDSSIAVVDSHLDMLAVRSEDRSLKPHKPIADSIAEVRLQGPNLIIDIPGSSALPSSLALVALTVVMGFATFGTGCALESLGLCCMGTLLLFPGAPLALVLGHQLIPRRSERIILGEQGLARYVDIDLRRPHEEIRHELSPQTFIELSDIDRFFPVATFPNDLNTPDNFSSTLPSPGIHLQRPRGSSTRMATNISTRGKLPIGSKDSRELRWTTDLLNAHLARLKPTEDEEN